MDAARKLDLLGRQTWFEPAEEVRPDGHRAVPDPGGALLAGSIYRSCTPAGPMNLLKGMVGNACERNCLYCPFRSGRDFERTVMGPDEVAGQFARLHEAGRVQGLFLSSAILGSGRRTQDRIIAVAELLRRRYRFGGYLHLKIMPGAEAEQIRRTMQLADRVSINLEAPNGERLASLAPHKAFREELVEPLRQVERIRQEVGGRPGTWNNRQRSGPSLATQFVVGPAGETDRELLRTTAYLMRHAGLTRTYFSAFRPVPDTPLAGRPPESPRRELRLYQASYLLRDYGFTVDDLSFGPHQRLPLGEDPKLAWAWQHLAEAPVEVNSAPPQELLRVPGIGPRLAQRLVEERVRGCLRDLSDLGRLGVAVPKAAPFILLAGKRPPRQLRLF